VLAKLVRERGKRRMRARRGESEQPPVQTGVNLEIRDMSLVLRNVTVISFGDLQMWMEGLSLLIRTISLQNLVPKEIRETA
jgi:hypothetical protein